MKLQRPSQQRAGTLRYLGPARPGPLHNRSGRGKTTSMGGLDSQVKAGPKNLGRSVAVVGGIGVGVMLAEGIESWNEN